MVDHKQVVFSPACSPEPIIVPTSTRYSALPSTQPAMPSVWIDNGVLTYFDGAKNKIIDFNEGEILDAFGNPTGIDI